MNKIRFVKREEIDPDKWDSCILHSSCDLPYAFSWYLDIVAEHWGGLIQGDYEVIMPLVWTTRMGFRLAYQPYFCQQLGLISGSPVEQKTLEEFMKLVSDKFSFVDINLNWTNSVLLSDKHFYNKTNLVLPLTGLSARTIALSENHKRNIAKAKKAGLQCSSISNPEDFLSFYFSMNTEKEKLKPRHKKIISSLVKELAARGMVSFPAVYSKYKAELLGAVMWVQLKSRFINLINTSGNTGKNTGAMHYLMHNLIENHANRAGLIDFEGSSSPSVARFYRGFGAIEQNFPGYRAGLLQKMRQPFGR